METIDALDDALTCGHVTIEQFEAAQLGLKIEAYKTALRRHDWAHEWSDDHRVWTAGRDSLKKLRAEAQRVDPTFAIWNLLAPASHRVAERSL